MFKSKTSTHALEAASTTIIGAGTTITGNMQCNGDIRIDGILKGNLDAKAKVIIGAEGLIEGDIFGKQADVMGQVNGKINISDLLYLHAKSTVNGDIFAGQLQIDPAAIFNGKCQMGGNILGSVNVIELNTNVERLALVSE
jgi:cytoskeletal protein CcmA (bactofilin family)